MKFVMIKKFAEKVWLYLYESLYSKETLRNYFDDDWFDDEYIESEKRKKNEVSYSKKSKFQPYRCPKCERTWRYYTLPKGKVPMREFLGRRVPMDKLQCPEELPCKDSK